MSPNAKKEDIQLSYDLVKEMIENNNYRDFERELEELPDIHNLIMLQVIYHHF